MKKKGLCLHFLKKIPVGDNLQLLEDEENAAPDEEGLVLGQSLVQEEEVAFAGRWDRCTDTVRTTSRMRVFPHNMRTSVLILSSKRSQMEKEKYSTSQLWSPPQTA